MTNHERQVLEAVRRFNVPDRLAYLLCVSSTHVYKYAAWPCDYHRMRADMLLHELDVEGVDAVGPEEPEIGRRPDPSRPRQ